MGETGAFLLGDYVGAAVVVAVWILATRAHLRHDRRPYPRPTSSPHQDGSEGP